MSCSPCLRRCFAVPFVHIVPPPRSVLLRSVRPAASCAAGRDPLSRAFACGRGRVFAPARFARLIARARGQAPGAAVPPASPGRRRVSSCDVMFAMPSAMLCRSVLHIVPPPRSVLLRSVVPATGLPGKRDPSFARIARARAPVCAGAVCAPDCPRTRGRRRAHLSRPFRRIFSKTAPPGRAAPGKQLRMPLPSGPF